MLAEPSSILRLHDGPQTMVSGAGVPWRALGHVLGTLEPSFGPLGRLFAGTLQKSRFVLCMYVVYFYVVVNYF